MTAAPYNGKPGHRGVDTSIEASDAMAPSAKVIAGRILRAYVEAADDGLTALEACARAVVVPPAGQPRVTELKLGGFIADSGRRRANASGKRARVMVALPKAMEAVNG